MQSNENNFVKGCSLQLLHIKESGRTLELISIFKFLCKYTNIYLISSKTAQLGNFFLLKKSLQLAGRCLCETIFKNFWGCSLSLRWASQQGYSQS